MAERICLGLATAVAIQHRRGEVIEKKLCEQNSQQDCILPIDVNNRIYRHCDYDAFGDTRFNMRRNSQTKLTLYMKNKCGFIYRGKTVFFWNFHLCFYDKNFIS
jgi:hypothetical protein